MERAREKAGRVARLMFQAGEVDALTMPEAAADFCGYCNGMGDPRERREFLWAFALAKRELDRLL
jgi:hypothetical protein